MRSKGATDDDFCDYAKKHSHKCNAGGWLAIPIETPVYADCYF